jgi:hypothetical protein
METEVIDVPDEIQAKPMDQQQQPSREPGLAKDEQIHQQPDPGDHMNVMREKLEKALKETQQQPPAKPDDKRVEAKVEAKPDANPDGKKEPEPETFTSAKAADWKKLKDARAAAEKERDDFKTKLLSKENEFLQLQTKLKAEDKTPEFTKELESIKAEKDKLLEKLEAIDLEKSPRFAEAYSKAFTSASTRAKDAVGTDKAELVEQLLQMAPSKFRKERLNEIREDLTGIDQGQFDIAVAEWDRAQKDKADALANSKENFTKMKAMDAERTQRENQLRQVSLQATTSRALEVARAYKAFQVVEGDEAHNASVKQNEDRVAKFFRMELPTEELFTIPIVAAEGRRLAEKVVPALEKEVAELKAALAQASSATPRVEGGQRHPAVGGGEKKGFVETFTDNWKGANG